MVLDGCKWPGSRNARLYLSLRKIGTESYLVRKEVYNRKKINEGTYKYTVQQKKCVENLYCFIGVEVMLPSACSFNVDVSLNVRQ
jgi:hypothetical protein